MEKIILHSDLNSFYASVELIKYPELRDKPVAVAGSEDARHGIILAKNDAAKKFGISTAETIWQAKAKCPSLIILPAHREDYSKLAAVVRRIYYDFSPLVEPFGLDEAWIDVTGSTRLFGTGEQIADEIRRRVTKETGLTVSIGVSFNKVFAKLGSDLRKPDFTNIITRENYKDIVWTLPVSDLLYVGRATSSRLKSIGIETIGELAKMKPEHIRDLLGVMGPMLWRYANGLDDSRVASVDAASGLPKSIGNSTTTAKDLITDEDVKLVLYTLCECVSSRMREQNLKGRTVTVCMRESDLAYYERQSKLDYHVNTCDDILRSAFTLYKKNKSGNPLRLMGVRMSDLIFTNGSQLSVIPEMARTERSERIEIAVDRMRGRYGEQCIKRAGLMDERRVVHDNIFHPEF